MNRRIRWMMLPGALAAALWGATVSGHPMWGTFWLFGGGSGDSGPNINAPGANLVWVDLFWGATPPHTFWRLCYAPEKLNLPDPCTHRSHVTHWTQAQLTHLDEDTIYRYEVYGWNTKRARWARHQRSCFYAHFSRWAANEDGVMVQDPIDLGNCRRLRRFHPSAS